MDDEADKSLYRVKPVYGFHAGVNTSFLVRERFYLNASLLYSRKGKVIEGKADRLLRNEVTYSFIDLPIVYTIDFRGTIANKSFKYAFGIGPNISYWLGGKGTISSTDLNELTLENQRYDVVFYKDVNEIGPREMGVDDPNRVQLGLNVTAGIVLEPAPLRKVMVTLRYELGHSYFSRTTDGEFLQTYYSDVMRARSQGLRLSIAYLVDLQVEKRKKGKSTMSR